MGVRQATQGLIVTKVDRCSPRVIDAYSAFYSGIIVDHLGKLGALEAEMKPLAQGMRLCGSAITVLGPDLSVRRMAIDLAEAGDVIVIAAGGVHEFACFGDGQARRMQLKGLGGIVIDGATRDRSAIVALGFPTYARSVTPRNYHYPMGGDYGSVNVPVVCGGVSVSPGDLVFGDDDGVVIIPRTIAEQTAIAIQEDLDEEARQRSPSSSYVPYDVEDELRQRGYRFE